MRDEGDRGDRDDCRRVPGAGGGVQFAGGKGDEEEVGGAEGAFEGWEWVVLSTGGDDGMGGSW